VMEPVSSLVANHGERAWIAFEYFPPKTESGVENLYGRIERMVECHRPLYLDFTWGAGGSTSDLTLELSHQAQVRFKTPSNMHLTCTNMPRDKIDHALKYCKENGIASILALRGDPPVGQTDFETVETGFSCALDLVKYIRTIDQDIGITVAGYPEGHPNVIKPILEESMSVTEQSRCVKMDDGSIHVCNDSDFEAEIAYLLLKVQAGAQMIVTQMFYDVDVFLTFVKKCNQAGINVPIIPGIMCITSYGGFKRMMGFCKTRVPEKLGLDLEAIKDDADAVQEYGIQFGIDTCNKLLENGVKGLHFYTLNQDRVVNGILLGLQLK